MARLGQPPRATAEQWLRAALTTIASRGLRAVSVEALARDLHVTKGSFYGYFSGREEFVRRALELWLDDHERFVLAPLAAVSDPVERFWAMAASTLLRRRAAALTPGPVAEVSQIELALVADRDDPVVAEVLHRIATARLDFLARCLTEIGHEPHRARQLAVSAYASSLGIEALRRIAPRLSDQIDDAYVDDIVAPFLRPDGDRRA